MTEERHTKRLYLVCLVLTGDGVYNCFVMKYISWLVVFISIVLVLQILILLWQQSFVINNTHDNPVVDDIIFVPAKAKKTQTGVIIDEHIYKNMFYSSISHFMTNKGTDGEMIDAAEHYFCGMTGGTVLEIGAYDGQQHSQSLIFEKTFGWQRILIEGNPHIGEKLRALNPDAISVNAAVCNDVKTLHWVGSNNGILEFLPMSLLRGVLNGALYEAAVRGNYILPNGQPDWSTFDFSQFPDVREIQCLPLHSVLKAINVTHINLFVLDVEGGELSILHTIDWQSTVFDVIVVETEVGPDGWNISQFLIQKDYVEVIKIGRNTWYRHHEYVPSYRAIRRQDLYLGHLLCQQNIRQFPERFIDGNGVPGDPILNQSCNIVCKSMAKHSIGKFRERRIVHWD